MHNIPQYDLISWGEYFVETHSFGRISGESSRNSVITVRFYKIPTTGN